MKDVSVNTNSRQIKLAEWIGVVLIFGIHLIVYVLSISDNDLIKEWVGGVAMSLSSFVPGSQGYEMLNRPYEIPYIQIFCVLFLTMPIGFYSFKFGATYDYDRSQLKGDGLFIVIIAALFILGVLLLLIPPEGYSQKNLSTYYGFAAPIRYAIVAGLLGYTARVMALHINGVLQRG